MSTLDTAVTATTPPALRIWMSASDALTDADVFLVRAGLMPLFGRVCRISDLANWPAETTVGFGWYRTDGVEIPLENCEDMKQHIESVAADLELLDVAAGSSPTSQTWTNALKYCRVNTQFGTLNVTKRAYGPCIRLDLTYTITEVGLEALLGLDGLFVLDAEEFELLRVATYADVAGGALGSTYAAVDEITVWMGEDEVAPFLAAIAGDIEDVCTYTADANDIDVL